MKKRKTYLLVAVLMVITMLFTACNNSTQSNSQNASNENSNSSKSSTKTITDFDGKSVTIPSSVKRVGVSIGAINQIILMLGSPDKVVATIPSMKANTWFSKMYPEIKDVATPFGGQVNIEEVAAAKPDVIFTHTGSTVTAEGLKSTNIPVVNVNISDPENLKKTVLLIGQVLGEKETKMAKEYNKYYDENVKMVTDKTKDLKGTEKVKVFVSESTSGENLLATEGKNTIVDSWINQAGGINTAAEGGIEGLGKKASMEDVIKWDPEVIITLSQAAKNNIMSSDQWKNINAVKNKKVYVNPNGVYIWSVRSGEAALQPLWAAKTLHPDVFKDLDINSETKRFYKTFYNYTMTDSDVDSILNPSK